MELVLNKTLGEVEFFGKTATAIREVYGSGEWKFVLLLENKRIVMLTF